MQSLSNYRQEANRLVQKQKKIQEQVRRADKNKPAKKETPMQAGARQYPEPPFSSKKLAKPGKESNLSMAPMYDAPFYKGSGKLQDMVAIITGADSGIGRSVAVLFAREGAQRKRGIS